MDALAHFTAWNTIATVRALARATHFAIAGVDVSVEGKKARIRAFDEDHESCTVLLLEDGTARLERGGEVLPSTPRANELAGRIVRHFNARVEERGIRESVHVRSCA